MVGLQKCNQKYVSSAMLLQERYSKFYKNKLRKWFITYVLSQTTKASNVSLMVLVEPNDSSLHYRLFAIPCVKAKTLCHRDSETCNEECRNNHRLTISELTPREHAIETYDKGVGIFSSDFYHYAKRNSHASNTYSSPRYSTYCQYLFITL